MRGILSPLRCALAAVLAAALCAPVLAQPEHDLLITNARVVDGSGNAWFYADVAVDRGRISAVGDLEDHRADKVFDAKNQILAPGFIDVHTHADEALHDLRDAENFIRDGVTTIVTGNCGGSVDDVAQYFDRLTSDTVTLNVATLYGHNTILRQVKGDKAGELDAEQWTKAKVILDKAMRDGAVGLSTGLIYTPGTYSPTEEIIELQMIAAKYGGIYVSHMRSEGPKIVSAIEEALRIGRETGSRVQISHFKMMRDVAPDVGGSNATLAMVEEARKQGQEVWVDQYPYTASSTTMNTMFPDWVLAQGRPEAERILQDSEELAKVYKDLRELHEVSRKRKSLDFAVVAWYRAHPEFNGLNLEEVAQVLALKKERGEDADWKAIPKDQWPAVTMDDQYATLVDIYLKGGASGVFHTMAEEDVQNIMRHPLVAICSDSGVRRLGEGMPHPRGYGSNARVLGRYVRELGVLTMEDAVRKMTSLPATAFRFEDRGLIRPGYAADIVVFDPDTVEDMATFIDPHQYSVGFSLVVVNGEVVLENGDLTGNRPGQPIHGPGYEKPKATRLIGG